jgi:predicted nucleic acid-binding protein
MIIYIDTSALVKRFVEESGTNEVNQLISSADIVGSSLLTQVEMLSAIGKASRMRWINKDSAEIAMQDFLIQWEYFTRLYITPTLIARSARLAWELGLRGYDATHLASALNWQETLETDVLLATYDKELWTAAIKSGLKIWPDNLIAQF